MPLYLVDSIEIKVFLDRSYKCLSIIKLELWNDRVIDRILL